MGVHGLWQLLSPVARPIALETMANKRLAIDASIWLYQFQMAMRDRKSGDPLQGAHIMGTFRRIVKLLYHGIKPVFVFDGDAPMLKKRTISERKRRKAGATKDLAKTAQQLLSAQLRAAAAEHQLTKKKKHASKSDKDKNTHFDESDIIDPSTVVYLEDLDNPTPSTSSHPTLKSPKKSIPKDQYALPTLDGSLQSRVKTTDSRLATEAELREFIEEMRPEDFDIDSEFFGNLPIELKYEIIGDLRIKSRQVNYKRVESMRLASTPLDFSRAQITNLMERNNLTQKLFEVTDSLGQSSIRIPTRVAGQKNREYLLVKQDVDKGGGWVLGVRNPVVGNTETVVIDDTSDESEEEVETDSDEFEEVGISPAKHRTPSPDRETRRILAIEAIRARYAPNEPVPDFDPYLDDALPTKKRNATSLFLPPQQGAEMDDDENEDAQLQIALFESAQDVNNVQEGFLSPAPAPLAVVVDWGEETDESLEYIDSRAASPAPLPPLPLQKPTTVTIEIDSDDDSDEFEEVQVLSVQPNSSLFHQTSKPTPISTTTPTLTSPPPPRLSSSPPSLPPLQTQPIGRAPRPTSNYISVMDSLLPSDSDYDIDVDVIQPTPRHSSPVPSPSRPPSIHPATSNHPSSIQALSSRELQSQTSSVPAQLSTTLLSTSATLPSSSHQSRSSIPPTLQAPCDSSNLSTTTKTLYQPASIPFASSSKLTLDDMAEIAGLAELVEDERGSSIRSQGSSKSEIDREGSLMETGRNRQEEDSKEEEEQADDDEEFFEGWEKSPTPPPRSVREDGRIAPPPEYDEKPDLEEEDMMDLEREVNGYADMISKLNNRDLNEMKTQAQGEMSRLTAQRNVDQRNADGVTRQMATDIKDLLLLFGIPYVDAPQEAEAECAELLNRHLVDGIVTDDSDVFLFGGSRIYRNMFNDNKYVECYLLADLERELGLDRDKLVRLAYLLGGDYADGLMGVGPVLGRELLEEFQGPDGLQDFKVWWSKVQSGKDDEDEDTNTAWRRKFKRGHKNLFIEDNWPNPIIAKAYYQPVVNVDDEPFSWAGPDLDGLRTYLSNSLSWTHGKTDEIMLPLIRRQNERKNGRLKVQGNLGDYFDISAGNGPLPPRQQRVGYASERLQNVVQTWRKNQRQNIPDRSDSDDSNVELPAPPARKRKVSIPVKSSRTGAVADTTASTSNAKPKPKAKPAANPKKKAVSRVGPPKTTAASRKRVERARKEARAAARGGDLSSDEDFSVIVRPPRAKWATGEKRPIVDANSDSEEPGPPPKRKRGARPSEDEDID